MRNLLKYPRIYNLYQSIIGARNFQKRFVNDYLKIKDGFNVLELGCGTGNIARFISKNVNYTGMDFCPNYINYVKNKFPYFKFFNKDLGKAWESDCTYNLVYAEAILSAMSEEQVHNLCESIKKCTNNESRIVFSDMNYSDSLGYFQKMLYKSERNNVIRSKDEYVTLLTKYFNIDNISVMEHIYRIPYSKLIFECSLKK